VENLKGKEYTEDQDIDERIILIIILKKNCVRTGLDSLTTTEISNGLL
jgi:hypothetical protein